MASFTSLITPLTKAQVEQAIYDYLAAAGVSTTSWKSGAVVRVIVSAVSSVGAAFSELQALIAKGGFLDLATGEWLTALALYVYDETRSTGSFATGEVTLTNAGAGVYSGVAGDLIVSKSGDGRAYVNTASYSLGAGPSSTTVAVQAIEIGTDSNAGIGDIDSFVTPLPGVTVSNAAALVGADEETDEALRQRCRLKLGSFSPAGPGDAYRYAAISAVNASGVNIGVTRVAVYPDGSGGVDVYVADADGTVSGTVGDLATDLGIVDADIQALAAPLAITANTFSATALPISFTYTIWLKDTVGLTTAECKTQISAALTAFLATVPIGGFDKTGGGTGYVYKQQLERVISDVFADDFLDLAVTTPAGDTTVPVDEAPTLGTPTATVNLVSL